MRSLFFLFFSFFLLLSFNGAPVITDIVEETCKKASQGDPQLSYDFCVTSLRADPRSQTADLQGLGLISMDLVISKGNTITSHITDLLKNTTLDPSVKTRLQDCLSLYSDAIPTMKEAINAFKAKDYPTANIKVCAALDASSTCEDGCKEGGFVCPIEKDDQEFSQLTTIPLAITTMF